jgi:antitoxin YefM
LRYYSNNLKKYCDKVTDDHETVIVKLKDEKKFVISRLEDYNPMMKATKNDVYLAIIDVRLEEFKNLNVNIKSMTEFATMESE